MNPTQERWLPVVGYEGQYEVSDHGNVRSLPRLVPRAHTRPQRVRGKQLSLATTTQGYKRVYLFQHGKGKQKLVHRLVLEAFVGPCPDGMEACHWDDDPANNHVSNLRWDTGSANMHDNVRNGGHHLASRTHCKRGHEFNEANTYINTSGYRNCRACLAALQRQYRRDRAEATRVATNGDGSNEQRSA